MSNPIENAASSAAWDAFSRINGERRSIRDFDGEPLADEDVRAILAAALLAPSSGNLQSYELHWVRDAATREALGVACEGQRAATSASAFVVVVARATSGLRTASALLEHVERCGELAARSKDYHRGQIRKFCRFLRIAPLALWSPIRVLLAMLFPVMTLLPIGPSGIRHWAARSSLYAAQTLLLAATARGLDACPMEGFSALAVAKTLGLPRDAVIPVVIALGRRRADAHIEPRWRRSFDDAVVVH